MNEEYTAHLERTLRAFARLVDKLEQITTSEEFIGVFSFYQTHWFKYQEPTWEKELAEAKECLREAEAIARAAGPADPASLSTDTKDSGTKPANGIAPKESKQ